MIELYNDDVPEKIQEFLKNNTDIEVTERIVRGLNGILYFGKRIKLGDEVALKFYFAGKDYDGTEEAVILRQIKHKHILEIFDLKFVKPHFPYFLTPKISGGDLQGIIDNRRLSSKEALNIIDGVLKGLNEMHSAHGLVHRDLKPGNILINLEDNNCPIIADLGAVKKIGHPNGFVSASKSTHLYLPPESVSRNEYYFQSDIYQVGVVMFQILGGYFPIADPYKWLTKRENLQTVAIRNERQRENMFRGMVESKIKKGTLIESKTLPFYLDDGFKRVINKAIHNDYQSRFSNPSLFLKEVHSLLRNCPEYIEEEDRLLIIHDTGKAFQIYENSKRDIIMEKNVSGKEWRKDNGHKGNLNAALNIARAK